MINVELNHREIIHPFFNISKIHTYTLKRYLISRLEEFELMYPEAKLDYVIKNHNHTVYILPYDLYKHPKIQDWLDKIELEFQDYFLGEVLQFQVGKFEGVHHNYYI